MITVAFNSEGVVEQIRALGARLGRPTALARVLGRSVNAQLKSHFREKDRTEPNKLGGPRTHFWRQVRDSVTTPEVASDGSTVTVAITQTGFAQRLFGGTIHPKRGLYTLRQLRLVLDASAERIKQQTEALNKRR